MRLWTFLARAMHGATTFSSCFLESHLAATAATTLLLLSDRCIVYMEWSYLSLQNSFLCFQCAASISISHDSFHNHQLLYARYWSCKERQKEVVDAFRGFCFHKTYHECTLFFCSWKSVFQDAHRNSCPKLNDLRLVQSLLFLMALSLYSIHFHRVRPVRDSFAFSISTRLTHMQSQCWPFFFQLFPSSHRLFSTNSTCQHIIQQTWTWQNSLSK